MDNVIQLLNAQYDTAPPKDHDEEITPIYQYLIDKFGDTSTTAFKLQNSSQPSAGARYLNLK
ncbi:hypothetical protein IC627_18845 [Photobacterium damselae subsp. piscicida]|nr:hypothetical protein IC627_18845 [Photobacterium damselae subsp. piscicida]